MEKYRVGEHQELNKMEHLVSQDEMQKQIHITTLHTVHKVLE